MQAARPSVNATSNGFIGRLLAGDVMWCKSKSKMRFFENALRNSKIIWFSLAPMANFTANADYEDKDSSPIHLKAGDEVTVGVADRAWPGWVWAEDRDGNDGYVPEDILEPLGEGRYAAMEDYDPSVLSIKRGDRIESLKQIHGWHWCCNEQGGHGWVAGYLLKPI